VGARLISFAELIDDAVVRGLPTSNLMKGCPIMGRSVAARMELDPTALRRLGQSARISLRMSLSFWPFI
jgi:hypothetical protein